MHGYENVLIVGSGGREHALGWKISQNEHIHKVIYANGNGGTSDNIQILPTSLQELAEYAKKNNCFTIIGPEVPLSMGIVDPSSDQPKVLPKLNTVKNFLRIL
jgi:phosphoribosylamine---glycine ligase